MLPVVSEASILQSVHFEMSTSWSEKPFQLQCYPWSQRPLFSRVFILKCSAHDLKLSPKCTDPQNPTWAQPWSKAAPTLGVKPQARLGEHAEVSRHRGSGLTSWSPESRKVTKEQSGAQWPGCPPGRPSSASRGLRFQPGKQDDESRTHHVRFPWG